MAKKIAVFNPVLEEALLEKLRSAAARAGYEIVFFPSEREGMEGAADAEIVYGFAPETARTSDALKWLCLPSAGADAYCRPGAMKHEETLLTNSAGAYGVALAEHAVMFVLMLVRRMPEFAEGMRRREWLGPRPQSSVKDSRVTLLGAGDIGREVARRLRGFAPASITAVSRSGKSGEPAFDRVVPAERLEEVLPETDILIMSLPNTPETAGILSRERLALLPETAYVVNVGRGTAIDEAALREALQNGKLAGAALDVMAKEPLPADDPLWDTPNLLMTPHIAGNLTVEHTRRRNVEMFCEDLENYAQGRPLAHLVDKKRMY